jgi:hypothetical protein
LINKVLPHFDAYILQGNKLKNYLIFREIVPSGPPSPLASFFEGGKGGKGQVNSKAHLTPEGLNKIKLRPAVPICEANGSCLGLRV